MDTSRDLFNYPELPALTLTNPDKTEIYSLSLAYNTKITLRFNALSEFIFDFPKSIDGNITTIEAYDYIQNKRLVLVEGYGYFQITNSEENSEGAVPIKTVTCKSLDNELTSKRVSIYTGTVALYNPISPAHTLLDDMIKLAPNWSVGTVDAGLIIKYRTFKVSDTNIYNFLMNDVCTAFECIFIFDTVNKTISAKALANATIPSDIFLSFDNVIKSSKFSEKSDEITTCLSVYGGGTLTITGVNPLGTNKIYDFSYYMTTNWMSQGLITAITEWEATMAANQTDYETYLLSLKVELGKLIVLQQALAVLQAEYTALETVMKTRIEAGMGYSDITALMATKQAEIDAKNAEISAENLAISIIRGALAVINTNVSFATNFTPSQLVELNEFIYENTYKNENIIITDIMTQVQIQEQQEHLYEQAQSVLSRISQPRYEFDLESVNYTAISDFNVFTSQTEVGTTVTAELQTGIYITAVLLEIIFGFNDPTQFTLKFSNRLRIDNGNFVYSDLMGSVMKTGSTVSFDASAWSNWDENYKDDVTLFIESALNTANNEIINSDKQEITLTQNGLRGKTYISEGVYNPTQVWLTSSLLAFTDNNWASAKLALGKITLPGGGTGFGLVAQYLVGNIIAGNSLNISNAGNNFLLNATGAYLNNAFLNLTTGASRILLDPTNAFLIQQNVSGSWVNKFRVDSNTGNVTFSGNLSGASGTFSGSIIATTGSIGGWTINTDGISDTQGNYINSNGDIRLGPLSINGSNGTFNGTFSATQLIGQVDNPQITDNFDASKLTFGTINTGVLFAGEIDWGSGARMYNGGYGISVIEGKKITIENPNWSSAGGIIAIYDTDYGDFTSIERYGGNINLEIVTGTGNIQINGPLYTSNTGGSGNALNAIRHITTSSGDFYFKFVNGILVDIYS